MNTWFFIFRICELPFFSYFTSLQGKENNLVITICMNWTATLLRFELYPPATTEVEIFPAGLLDDEFRERTSRNELIYLRLPYTPKGFDAFDFFKIDFNGRFCEFWLRFPSQTFLGSSHDWRRVTSRFFEIRIRSK